MGLPTLSVILPNYNHRRFLPAYLKAILSQSVPATEVIVIDDASTDNSMDNLKGSWNCDTSGFTNKGVTLHPERRMARTLRMAECMSLKPSKCHNSSPTFATGGRISA